MLPKENCNMKCCDNANITTITWQQAQIANILIKKLTWSCIPGDQLSHLSPICTCEYLTLWLASACLHVRRFAECAVFCRVLTLTIYEKHWKYYPWSFEYLLTKQMKVGFRFVLCRLSDASTCTAIEPPMYRLLIKILISIFSIRYSWK